MNSMLIRQSTCAAFFAAATATCAFGRTLPLPEPGGYVDTESSTNVPFGGWQGMRRRFTLVLDAESSPTGCVQVALGRDLNLDGDLAPEETAVVVGRDCGAWFARDERSEVKGLEGGQRSEVRGLNGGQRSEVRGQTVEFSNHSSTFNFEFTLPKDPADRWNLAKVTTRGTLESTPAVRVKYGYDGIIYFVR